MITCPPVEKLSQFLAGTCPEEESARIEAHVAACESCCQVCLSSETDQALLSQLRSAMQPRSIVGEGSVVGDSVLTRREPGPDAEPEPIEGYRILRELGRGGMGVVYLAHQESTRRDVALKVLLQGPFSSANARRRFEREVEVVARLSHPHIVSIFESGITRGRHYFAMEHIQGVRLDRYVARRGLSIRDTLALFVKVCRAVAHAHQRGVIHRDLKPSNILVDDAGEPHVLDFGLAKEEAEADSWLVSLPGQMVGTVPYMAPEQITGTSLDVDVRTDVYALGVILFRLLTGEFPYPVTEDARRTARHIVETPPGRPRRHRREIDADVETIVLRALAKERARRYQSAGDLAADLERYLQRRPIDARRDDAVYVLRKYIGRHRVAVVITLVLLVITTLGIATRVRYRAAVIQGETGVILSTLVDDVDAARRRLAAAAPPVQRRVGQTLGWMVASPAYTERITGARGALFANPEAFWEQVDSKALWQNGEWLELAEAPAETVEGIRPELMHYARHGSDRQKYVAFCLLGRLGRGDPHLAALCLEAVRSETDPGVVAAAAWAARRQNNAILRPSNSETLWHDPLSRLTFVRLPGHEGFVPGSPPDDPDRFADEDQPDEPVVIQSFHIAQTETTWSAFAPFLDQPAGQAVYAPRQREWMEAMLATLPEAERATAAVGYITHAAARAYCAWLTEQGELADPPRRYRLPTEAEWEYASRGGNEGRFCFGHDARYARYFAHSEGHNPTWPVTGRYMPNAFGLFDMHGSLWEWTASAYPKALLPEGQRPVDDLWVYKGGAFYSPAVRCRSAQRNYGAGAATDYNGFRVVMELIEP